jgi:hypothetical protein
MACSINGVAVLDLQDHGLVAEVQRRHDIAILVGGLDHQTTSQNVCEEVQLVVSRISSATQLLRSLVLAVFLRRRQWSRLSLYLYIYIYIYPSLSSWITNASMDHLF